ncbi:MFS transporter [Parvularcula dongshanensis]|uniref:MFS family permease n=1 Tax=Parvularcula dongshanensis TaxID=1173995 RepID=A0A840I4A5_9PROT|nr:MFS transporter [Parvularcula dongshanensis]MBB4659816.1 MFS family permease [Parvularcula dongshanensis]
MSTTQGAAAGDRGSTLGLIAAIAAISVAGIGFGHSIPLFSVLLERYGASSFANGLNTAVGALAVLVCAPIYPRLIVKVGMRRFLVSSIVLMVVSYGLIYVAEEAIWLWYPLRFVFSVGASGLFVGSEIWINAAADPARRGRVIGVYSTCLALGLALGPLMLNVTGYDGAAPFIAGALVFALAAIPIALAPPPSVDPDSGADRILPLLTRAPVTFGASAMFGAVESAMLVFLPLLALDAAFGERVAAQTVTAYCLGSLALQYLVGRAADVVGIMSMLFAMAAGAAVSAALLPLANDRLPTLFACAFALGGLINGISTCGLTLLGDRFSGSRLPAAGTAYAFAWGLGAVTGPAAAGLMRDAGGPDAMMGGIVVALVLYAVAALLRRGSAFP